MKPDMPVYAIAWTEAVRQLDPISKRIVVVPSPQKHHGIGVRLWMATRFASALVAATRDTDAIEPAALFELADRIFDYYKNESADEAEAPLISIREDDHAD